MPPRRPRGQIAREKGRYGQGGRDHRHHRQRRDRPGGGNRRNPGRVRAAASASQSRQPQSADSKSPSVLDRPGPIPAGPAVRRMAREQGIDLRTVAGSGKYGASRPKISRPLRRRVRRRLPAMAPLLAANCTGRGPCGRAARRFAGRVRFRRLGARCGSRRFPASAARSPSR